jgi:hypothetical protein
MKSRILLTGVGVAALAVLSGQGTQPEHPRTTDPTRPGQPTQPGQPSRPGETPGRPGDRPMTPTTPSTPTRDTMTTPGRTGQPGTSERAQRPGAEHQALDWMTGQWTATATQWREANATPMEFRGMLNSTWVLDQRFLRNEFLSDKEGMPFQGVSFIGYNPAGGEYQGVWMDTTSNEIAHSTGEWNAGTKTLTLNGEFTDPQTNQKMTTRTEARQESPDRFTWEMFNTPQGGTEFKSLQIVFTKRGGMTPGTGQRPTMTPGGTTPATPPSTTTPRSPSATPPSTTPPSNPGESPRTPPSDPTRPSTPPAPR